MTKARRNPWDRLFWAVRFTGVHGKSFLIGTLWHRAANEANEGYPGEPTRALLFTRRSIARRFCAEQRIEAKKRGGVCAKWKFSPVRVRERVNET